VTSRVCVSACLAAAAVVASSTRSGYYAQSALYDQPPNRPFDLQLMVRIPMRDGVSLAATIYRPPHTTKRLPIVMTLTPYTADRWEEVGRYFAEHGYIFAAVDSRGRGDSGGEFDPWVNEGADGADVVTWLAAQPFCDGRVVTWGGSYSGKNQWALAANKPAGLAAIAPASAGYVGYDMGMLRNIPFPYMLRWLSYISGKSLKAGLFNDDAYWLGANRDLSRGEISYREFDALSGNASPIWRKWLSHPEPDEYWALGNPSADKLASIDVPVLSLTGTYDDAQLGTLRYWAEHRVGTPRRSDRDYLIIGPWDHGGSRNPQVHLGGLSFDASSALNVKALHVEWYNWLLRGGPPPAFLKDHFIYYVAGAEEWRSAATIEAASSPLHTLYLASENGPADSQARPGLLTDRAPARDADSFIYDPGMPAHNEGFEGGAYVGPDYLTTDRIVRRIHGDGLIYDTGPFSTPIEIVGRPRVTLTMKMNVPDTDVRVQFYAVEPDGRTIYLTQDYLRARYRNDETRSELVPLGVSQDYVFDRFYFNARTLPAGSIIRMLVVPLGASLHNQRNRNSGGPVADETAEDNRIATIEVLLGPGLSRVQLPLRPFARSRLVAD
jgi:putative CocE/NonD family hydrolase